MTTYDNNCIVKSKVTSKNKTRTKEKEKIDKRKTTK